MLPGKSYKPEDILQIAKKRIWMILVPFAVVSAVVAVVAHKLPDRFRSETVILVVPQRVPESYVRATVTTRIEDRLQSLTQQILSRTRLERIILDFNLYADARRTGIMEDIVEKMRDDIGIQVVRGDAFKISYMGTNPRTVMRVTERLASLFIEENLRDREVLAEGTNQFLEAQLEDARRRLEEQEKKVEEYRKRFSGQLPSQLDSNLEVLHNSQMQIQALVESINRDKDQRLIIERQITDLQQDIQAMASANGATTASTPAQQLAAAKATLAALQTRLTPDHPDVKRMAKIVRDLEQKADSAAADQPLSAAENVKDPAQAARSKHLEDLKLQMALLDRQIAKKEDDEKKMRDQVSAYQGRVEAAPTRETEMTELTRDYDTLQASYKSLLSKKEDAQIAANLERRQIGEQFKLLDPAQLPEKPFSPDRVLLNGAGVAGGLAIGLLIVAALEYLDKSFKTDEEVSRVLSLPVLAVVPAMQSTAERQWAFRKRLLIGLGCGTTVVGCFSLVAYTLLH